LCAAVHEGATTDFETAVKMQIYSTLAETGAAPGSQEVAGALDVPPAAVEDAFRALQARRLLVPEPGDPSRIRMAPPFSGIRTPFRVLARGRIYYANCVWDALGIPAALHASGRVAASDGQTGEAMELEVRDGTVVARSCAVHFAVPAARWWDDIVHT
jgi:alkylmercury lyase-like protein